MNKIIVTTESELKELITMSVNLEFRRVLDQNKIQEKNKFIKNWIKWKRNKKIIDYDENKDLLEFLGNQSSVDVIDFLNSF